MLDQGCIYIHFLLVFAWINNLKATKIVLFIFFSFFLMFRNKFLSFFAFQNVPFSSQKSGLIVFHTQVVKLSFFGDIDIHDFESVLNEGFLYFKVQGSVSGETGSMVDFKKDGLSIIFEHDIKSQNVKAHVSSVILRLAALVLVAHDG
jgi:hypothetical protein